MSVANVFLEADRIRIVTDTVGYLGTVPAAFRRKVHLSPAASVAVTARGLSALGDAIAERSGEWISFSAALAVIMQDLEEAPARYFPCGAEVTVAGFNEGAAAVQRFFVKQGKEGAIGCFTLAAGSYLAPSLGSHSIPAKLTEQQMVKIALLQQDLAVRHGLNICVGGDIELTEITRDSASICKIGEYPNKAATADAIAAQGVSVELAA